jgi:hypothetical protein
VVTTTVNSKGTIHHINPQTQNRWNIDLLPWNEIQPIPTYCDLSTKKFNIWCFFAGDKITHKSGGLLFPPHKKIVFSRMPPLLWISLKNGWKRVNDSGGYWVTASPQAFRG